MRIGSIIIPHKLNIQNQEIGKIIQFYHACDTCIHADLHIHAGDIGSTLAPNGDADADIYLKLEIGQRSNRTFDILNNI